MTALAIVNPIQNRGTGNAGVLNRRKLVQLVLSEIGSERTYIEFKRQIDMDSEAGRAKVLRSIASLANSNPNNNAYILYGVDDFGRAAGCSSKLDDQRIQQLAREYLDPSPEVLFENIPYPESGSMRFIGLLTVSPGKRPCLIKKAIWKLAPKTYLRRSGSEIQAGSTAVPTASTSSVDEVRQLESKASVRLADTIEQFAAFRDGVGESYHPEHEVFHDQHVVCFSGWREDENPPEIRSECRVVLLTEGVELFWSALEYVSIETNGDHLRVVEHALFFWESARIFVPVEATTLSFTPDGRYHLTKERVFRPISLTSESVNQLLTDYRTTLTALTSGGTLISTDEFYRLETYPWELLLAALHGNAEARNLLLDFPTRSVGVVHAEEHKRAIEMLSRIERDQSEID